MTNGVGAAGVAGVGLGAAGIILDIVSLPLALDQSDVLIEVKRDIEDIEKLCIVVHNKVFEKSGTEEPGKRIIGQGGEIVTTWQRTVQEVKVFFQESGRLIGEALTYEKDAILGLGKATTEFAGRVGNTYLEGLNEALKGGAKSQEAQFEGVKDFIELIREFFRQRTDELKQMKQKYPFLFLGPLAKTETGITESPIDKADFLAERKELPSMEPMAMRMTPEAYADLIVAAVPDAVVRAHETAAKTSGEKRSGVAGASGAQEVYAVIQGLIESLPATVESAVISSLSRAAGTGAGPGSGSCDLTQTASANHEQLIQLLSAIKGGEDQIFLYQQLAYSDLVAIRNQLKEMGCDPISNMYDHRNMKI
jgi:hypothetical protein